MADERFILLQIIYQILLPIDYLLRCEKSELFFCISCDKACNKIKNTFSNLKNIVFE